MSVLCMQCYEDIVFYSSERHITDQVVKKQQQMTTHNPTQQACALHHIFGVFSWQTNL